MPSYDLRTAAFVVGCDAKWIDNLASHADVPGVLSTRRGVGREFTFDGIVASRVIWLLNQDFKISLWRAVEIAVEVLQAPGKAFPVSSGISLSIDRATIEWLVNERLLHAAESVPRMKRGPPTQTPVV